MTEHEPTAAPPLGDATLDTPPRAESPSDGAASAPTMSRPGRYRIDGELARGGFGRVLLAFDLELGRPVALKTLLVDTPVSRARFAREATFTASLQHPAIASIYDADVDEHGAPFHAMPLVTGETLGAAISRTTGLDERLALLPHVQTVADAIAYAHSRGVIHRDIKPANVLIGPFGETVVIDWGVAKAIGDQEEDGTSTQLNGDDGLTMVGSAVGTPAYMAPEQARGESIDARIDVYALGALLYHVLAGAPPVAGGEHEELERRRRGEAPPELTTRAPGLPVDLDRIVRKAMSLSPGSRYASAAGLADDLRRFQTGQLISAHEYGRLELLRRWFRRHAAAVTIATMVLVAVGLMAGYGVKRIVRERDRAESARMEALARGDALILAQAGSERMRDPTSAAAWLESYPDHGHDSQRRFDLALATTAEPVAWSALRHDGDGIAMASIRLPGGRAMSVGRQEVAIWSLHGAPAQPERVWRERQPSTVTAMAVLENDDGPTSTVALGVRDGSVIILDALTTGKRPLARVNGALTSIAGSAKPPVIAAATDLSLTRLSGPDWGQREDHAARVRHLAVARDGSIVFTTNDALWRWSASEAPTALSPLIGPITALVVSPDVSVVYGGSVTGEVIAQPTGTAERGSTVRKTFPNGITALALTADGRELLVGDKSGQVSAVDSKTLSDVRPLFRHSEAVAALSVQPHTRTIASTSADGRLALWSLATGASRVFRGHDTLIGPISFSPDGAWVSTIGMDGLVRLWRAGDLTTESTYVRPALATHAAFSEDGRSLACDGDAGSVLLVDLETGTRREERLHTGNVYGIEASPTGSLFVSAGYDGQAIVWDAARGSHEILSGHEGRVRKAQFGTRGSTVYTAGNDGTIRRFELGKGSGEILQRFPGRVLDLEVLSDENVLLAVRDDGTLRATTIGDGRTRVVASGLGGLPNNTFELGRVDDEAVLVCRGAGRIERYGAEGDLEAAWEVEGPINSTRLAGRGRRVAYPVEESLWVFDGNDPPVRIGRSSEAIHNLTLSALGDVVVTASLDGAVTVWRLDGSRAELQSASMVTRHDGAAFGAALSPDGGRVASVGFDQRLRLSSLDASSWVPAKPERLGEWLRGLTTWRVDGDKAVPIVR